MSRKRKRSISNGKTGAESGEAQKDLHHDTQIQTDINTKETVKNEPVSVDEKRERKRACWRDSSFPKILDWFKSKLDDHDDFTPSIIRSDSHTPAKIIKWVRTRLRDLVSCLTFRDISQVGDDGTILHYLALHDGRCFARMWLLVAHEGREPWDPYNPPRKYKNECAEAAAFSDLIRILESVSGVGVSGMRRLAEIPNRRGVSAVRFACNNGAERLIEHMIRWQCDMFDSSGKIVPVSEGPVRIALEMGLLEAAQRFLVDASDSTFANPICGLFNILCEDDRWTSGTAKRLIPFVRLLVSRVTEPNAVPFDLYNGIISLLDRLLPLRMIMIEQSGFTEPYDSEEEEHVQNILRLIDNYEKRFTNCSPNDPNEQLLRLQAAFSVLKTLHLYGVADVLKECLNPYIKTRGQLSLVLQRALAAAIPLELVRMIDSFLS